jgi:hypothetical protein
MKQAKAGSPYRPDLRFTYLINGGKGLIPAPSWTSCWFHLYQRVAFCAANTSSSSFWR